MRACTPAPLLELLRNKVLRAGPAGLTAGGVTSIDTLDIFGVCADSSCEHFGVFDRHQKDTPGARLARAAVRGRLSLDFLSFCRTKVSNIKYKVLGIK